MSDLVIVTSGHAPERPLRHQARQPRQPHPAVRSDTSAAIAWSKTQRRRTCQRRWPTATSCIRSRTRACLTRTITGGAEVYQQRHRAPAAASAHRPSPRTDGCSSRARRRRLRRQSRADVRAAGEKRDERAHHGHARHRRVSADRPHREATRRHRPVDGVRPLSTSPARWSAATRSRSAPARR